MDFQVKHPKLEYEPGQFREGVRRFHFSKNMNSYDFPSETRSNFSKYSPSPSKSDLSSYTVSPEVMKLKQQILEKQQEIERLKNLSEAPENIKAMQSSINPSSFRATERTARSSYDYNLFEIAKHPAFQQPKFTKHSPKVIITSPITGYNYSERSLGQYGSMILASKS